MHVVMHVECRDLTPRNLTMWLTLALFLNLPFMGKLTPELQLAVLTPKEKVTVIVHMVQEYPYDDIKNLSIHERAQVFKDIAKASQQPLIDYLKQFPEKVDSIRQFWVFNGFYLKATKDIIEEIARGDDVWFISHNAKVELPPIESGEEIPYRAIEWNVRKIMADSCWNAGYIGAGIYIGHIDTGVDFGHPALQGHWSGKWRDCVNGQPNPYDDHNHGTHTCGTLCGGDGFGSFTEDIGVAPGTRIVAAKSFNQSGSGQYVWVDAAMQWMADLKADSGIDIRVVNNSWGSSSTTDLHFWNICNTWKSLGILPAFAVGGSGPGAGTVGIPANYPLNIGSGATDSNDNIASFSSRGPAPNQNPWNDPQYWYRPDWNRIKPDIAAPGVSVRSSVLGNGYQTWSGTSMAVPHICGSVAILCQANPNLTVREIYNILLNNADHPSQGAPYPNNNYGWGRLNIWKSLQTVIGIEERTTLAAKHATLKIYPNPANERIKFQIQNPKNQTSSKSQISIKIYDATGQLVRQWDYETVRQSDYVVWDTKDNIGHKLPTGVYFLKIKIEDKESIKKLVIAR